MKRPYKTLDLGWSVDADREAILNQQFEQGWELVSVDRNVAYLKRRTESTDYK